MCTWARMHVSGKGKARAQEPSGGGAERGQSLRSARAAALNVLEITKACALRTQRATLESLLDNNAKAHAQPRLGGRAWGLRV